MKVRNVSLLALLLCAPLALFAMSDNSDQVAAQDTNVEATEFSNNDSASDEINLNDGASDERRWRGRYGRGFYGRYGYGLGYGYGGYWGGLGWGYPYFNSYYPYYLSTYWGW